MDAKKLAIQVAIYEARILDKQNLWNVQVVGIHANNVLGNHKKQIRFAIDFIVHEVKKLFIQKKTWLV